MSFELKQLQGLLVPPFFRIIRMVTRFFFSISRVLIHWKKCNIGVGYTLKKCNIVDGWVVEKIKIQI